MDFLFVYGTLRSDMGHPMHGVLERYAQFVSVGTVPGHLFNLGHYPGLVITQAQNLKSSPDAASRVWGEIYALKADTVPTLLVMLDDYESYNPDQIEQSEYRREIVQVQLENNVATPEMSQHQVSAWVYVYNQDSSAYPVIPSGNYADVVPIRSRF